MHQFYLTHLSMKFSHQTVVGWRWCLVWWICWSCKVFSATPPDLLFQRLSASSPWGFCSFLMTGNGGSISTMLIQVRFSLLPFMLTCLLLPQLAVVVVATVVGRFLLENIFLSLEYLTLLLLLMMLLVLCLVFWLSLLWVAGKPTTLLFLFTWPMQLILGDKGSLEKDTERSSHLGIVTSLMDGFEHNMGMNVFLEWRFSFWWGNRLYSFPIWSVERE